MEHSKYRRSNAHEGLRIQRDCDKLKRAAKKSDTIQVLLAKTFRGGCSFLVLTLWQSLQSACRFLGSYLAPPRHNGTMWSIWSGPSRPQYLQRCLSRSRIERRVRRHLLGFSMR